MGPRVRGDDTEIVDTPSRLTCAVA